ncbi:hypothetical protein [Paraliobacillus sp. JSM ZJ581]|uniref:hypothetical protein n=1 Tax=Paraliobacillus sp. JSM ZJ581 TaxID=3342118 RepID=UPI0035A98F06
MVKAFKAVSSGLSFTFFYVLTVFITPIILLLLGKSNIVLDPAVFGSHLYIIKVEETTFSTEATILGGALSFVIGVVIHFVIIYLLRFKRNATKEA